MRAGSCLFQPKSADVLGDALSAGVEALSGVPMEGVRVHRNSPQPAEIGALAFAQGRDIHLGPGQEQHLPHEAWHVAQQFAGRVRPTAQAGGVPVNDDPGLEREADVMGARALAQGQAMQRKRVSSLVRAPTPFVATGGGLGTAPFQRRAGVAAMDLELGTTTRVMTREGYDAWRGTMQAKLAPHGSAPLGDRVVVSQFRPGEGLAQLISDKWKNRIRAGLVILEGAITVAAGTAAAILSGGIGVIPGIMAGVVGVLKIGRGAAMILWDEDDPAKKPVLDLVRQLEAEIALVAALATGDPRMIVFGIAKLIRALITLVTDGMGKDTDHPKLRKALLGVSAFAHAVEVAMLGLSAEAAISGAETTGALLGGAAKATVAGSKGLRTLDQGKTAWDAPTKKDVQDGEAEAPGFEWTAPEATPTTEVAYVT